MHDELLSVVQWPAALNSAQELLIVAVDTPKSPIRDAARQLVRAALSEILGDAELLCEPGQAIRLAQPDSPLGISVSHENGLSLLLFTMPARSASICCEYRKARTGWNKFRCWPTTGWARK